MPADLRLGNLTDRNQSEAVNPPVTHFSSACYGPALHRRQAIRWSCHHPKRRTSRAPSTSAHLPIHGEAGKQFIACNGFGPILEAATRVGHKKKAASSLRRPGANCPGWFREPAASVSSMPNSIRFVCPAPCQRIASFSVAT